MRSFEPVERHVVRHVLEINQVEVLGLVRDQVAKLELDLSGMTVVAGAATGYQVAVATMAALGGASRVLAFTRESRAYSNAADAAAATLAFARSAGVAAEIEILDHLDGRRWAEVDIIASCAQVGAISRSIAELLPPRAVISLMAEPWELRPGFVDIDACRHLDIKVVAPNFGHPTQMLLPDFARLSCMLVDESGLETRGSKLAVISDTPCGPFIEQALRERGALVSVFAHPLELSRDAWDGIIVALRPSDKPPMNINNLGRILENAPDALLVQFSGEIDRSAAGYFGMRVWPPKKPGRGQLGLPFDVLGPKPTISKVAAGLKAAEAAYRGIQPGGDAIGFLVAE